MKKTWIKNTVVMLLTLAMVCGVCLVAGEKVALAAKPTFNPIPTITNFGADAIDLATYYTGANAGDVTYAIRSGSTVLTVSEAGVVETIKNGTAVVRATEAPDGEQSAYTDLTLKVQIDGQLTLPATAEVLRNGTLDLTADAGFSSTTGDTLTWKSSATAVATVSAAGVVSGLSGGTTTITVKSAITGASATCKVSVVAPSISVSKPNPASIASLGGTAVVTATLNKRGDAAMGDGLRWYSSNDNIATVVGRAAAFADGNAVADITAVKGGTATIYCASTEDGYTKIIGSTTISIGGSSSSGGTVSGGGTGGMTISTDDTSLVKNQTETLWISVDNPHPDQYGTAWAKVTRTNRRVYLEGWDEHDTTLVYYVALDGSGNASLSVLPQYDGSVKLTVEATGARPQSITYTVSGYPTLPQGGQDSTLIYVLGGCCLLAAATWVALYAKKKKNSFAA